MSTFEIVALICFIISGLFFVLSVVLFFVLDMVKVIGDLTGHTAKREIENIRSQNQKTGNKAYKPSVVNSKRGKLTDRISPSGRILENRATAIGGSVGTEKIASQKLYSGYEETTLLENGQEENSETTLLSQNNGYTSEASVMGSEANETSLLNPGAGETTVLNGQDQTTVLDSDSSADGAKLSDIDIITVDISLLQEIKLISTQEIIY